MPTGSRSVYLDPFGWRVKYDQKKKEELPPIWDMMTASGLLLDHLFRWEGEDLILDNCMLDLDVVKKKVQHGQYGAL